MSKFIATESDQGYAAAMDICHIARQSIRTYFAPLVGVWNAKDVLNNSD